MYGGVQKEHMVWATYKPLRVTVDIMLFKAVYTSK